MNHKSSKFTVKENWYSKSKLLVQSHSWKIWQGCAWTHTFLFRFSMLPNTLFLFQYKAEEVTCGENIITYIKISEKLMKFLSRAGLRISSILKHPSLISSNSLTKLHKSNYHIICWFLSQVNVCQALPIKDFICIKYLCPSCYIEDLSIYFAFRINLFLIFNAM